MEKQTLKTMIVALLLFQITFQLLDFTDAVDIACYSGKKCKGTPTNMCKDIQDHVCCPCYDGRSSVLISDAESCQESIMFVGTRSCAQEAFRGGGSMCYSYKNIDDISGAAWVNKCYFNGGGSNSNSTTTEN